jgi:hypothetical protein
MVDIAIGSYYIEKGGRPGSPEIICDSPALAAHICRPWFIAYGERQLGERLRSWNRQEIRGEAVIEEAQFEKPCLVVGSTGSGKTRTIRRIAVSHLQRGYSLVAFLPKYQDLLSMVADVQASGLSPSALTVVSPNLDHLPGWNPLDAGLPLSQCAGDLAAIIDGISPAHTPRMSNLVLNAILVVAAHGLSAFELVRMLQRPDFRERLIRRPLPDKLSRPDRLAYHEAADFFTHEFDRWGKAEQASALAPALNRLGEITRSYFLQALLAGPQSTIDLASLWQRQGVLLVHTDPAALGSSACARFLAGAFMSSLFRTAQREPGPRPVLLAVDELASTERLVGETLLDILTMARALKLRLIAGLQFLDQASEHLRKALLSQTAVQIFGRLGPDARLVANSLAVGTGSRLTRLVVSADEKPGAQRISVSYKLRDQARQSLKLSPSFWEALCRMKNLSERLRTLYAVAARYKIGALYVVNPLTHRLDEVGGFLGGLPESEWELTGPNPVGLTISFPRPVFSGLKHRSEHERELALVRLLQSLTPQQAVLRVAGGRPGLIQVCDVPDHGPDPRTQQFLQAAARANGHSSAEVVACLRRRREQVDGATRSAPIEPESADGSIF